MRVFFYDGSFEGILSAVFEAYTLKIFPDLLLEEGAMAPLQTLETHRVMTVPARAERVFAALSGRISPEARQELLLAWLAEEPGRGDLIFRYLRCLFDIPEHVELDYLHPACLGVREAAGRVSRESHLLRGFARFQKSRRGIYFCALGPRHNVLPLLLEHFSERLAGQRWVLYDQGRGYGIYCDGYGFQEMNNPEALSDNGRLNIEFLEDKELFFQELWKTYFKAAAVRERANPKLQAAFLPRRFWKYMLEKQG